MQARHSDVEETPAADAGHAQGLDGFFGDGHVARSSRHDRDARFAVLRDPNRSVHVHVLRNPGLMLDEIQAIARMTTVSVDLLSQFAQKREWGHRPEIAIALVSEPELLLLDEPTAGMGPEETKDMVALLERLADKRTVLLVEHKMKMVLGLSKRVVVLHHGRLLADGAPDEIRSNPEVRQVYLGQSEGYG